MLAVRIHGRGGQGAVTAAELLSMAAFLDDRYSQAFPSFGSERTGAPVVSFCRISDRPIRTREPIAEPDAIVIIDPTLLHQVDLFGGLRDAGTVVINTKRPPQELGLAEVAERFRLLNVPATDIARRRLKRPLPNAVLIGALAAATGAVTREAVLAAVRDRFAGKVGEANAAAVEDGYRAIAGAGAAVEEGAVGA